MARIAHRIERLRCHEQTTAMAEPSSIPRLGDGGCGLVCYLSDDHGSEIGVSRSVFVPGLRCSLAPERSSLGQFVAAGFPVQAKAMDAAVAFPPVVLASEEGSGFGPGRSPPHLLHHPIIQGHSLPAALHLEAHEDLAWFRGIGGEGDGQVRDSR